jgi:hypothetical protein
MAEAGRPTVWTDELVRKMETLLQNGLSIDYACHQAQIGRTTFYDKLNSDEDFRTKMLLAKEFFATVSEQTMGLAIKAENDELQRRIKKFEDLKKKAEAPNATKEDIQDYEDYRVTTECKMTVWYLEHSPYTKHKYSAKLETSEELKIVDKLSEEKRDELDDLYFGIQGKTKAERLQEIQGGDSTEPGESEIPLQ